MTTAEALDIAWILIAAALVMLMQAGFAALESGLVRTKNSINVAAKNFADFLLSTAVYWFAGFAIMFGASQAGLFGTSQFLFDSDSPWLIAFFVFQVGFVGAAVTIVSGAVAERMRFSSYLIVALLMSALLYPVFGHWAWAGAAGLGAPGWLEDLGFIDFAGSTVVHSVGGWLALAAVLVIGPRLGRFGPGSVPIRGHDVPLVTLGVFILWFGWFGFNGGSTLGVTSDVPMVIMNTTLSAAFGGLVAMGLSWLRDEHPDVPTIMNGALAGLVGITASANIVAPLPAVIIGSAAGLIMYLVTLLLERFRVDDAVGAVPVHLSAGIWGTLAVAIFGRLDAFGDGVGRIEQLGFQLVGIGAAFVWVFGLGYLILRTITRFHPLRIDPEGEHQGLNIAEHGASTELVDLLTAMDTQRASGDYSQAVEVEPNTEVGQIAGQYNLVLAAINKETASLELLQRVSAAVNEASDLEEAYRIVLREVSDYGGWQLAHVYAVSADGSELAPTDIWRPEDAPRFKTFMEGTAAVTFAAGEGLPGAAAAARQPLYLDAKIVDSRFATPVAVPEVQIKSGLALPVLVGQEAVAVLEFFVDEEGDSTDSQMLALMASVGTQLGRAVERRRADEARFRTVVDYMPALVFLRDLDGRFLLVNHRYEEFYGVTSDVVEGRTLAEVERELGVGLRAEALTAQDREVLAKNEAIEYELELNVGERKVYLASLKFPIPDATGRAIALGGIETDVTEHRMLEAELTSLVKKEEAARGQLEVALEQLESSELIIERWTIDGTVVAMNPFGLDLFGFSEDEVIGRNAFESFVPDDEAVRTSWIDSGELLFQNPSQYAESELECQKKDGTRLWVAFRNKAILGADGDITEVLSVGLDVTERRELEAQLQAANLRMEGELNIGRDIQMSMLPQHFPAFPDRDEFVVYATLEPAREVGGDLYDFFLIDEDHLCFLVGDVSDKGVPAALFMAVTKTAIKSQAMGDADTASIMTHVNDELAENNESSMFVTLFVVILDTRTGQMTYTNAGHNPPYVKKAGGSVITLDDRHGPVAGAIEGITFGSSELTLEPGDAVVMYTDGVTEAMDIDHVQFGDATLETLIADASFESTEVSVALVNAAVAVHRGEAEQSDDITVLALEFKGLDPAASYIELTLPATLESLAEVMERFGEFSEEHGLDDKVRRQVLLVLDDLLNNIATYAYEGIEADEGETQGIELRVELTPTRLVITISDSGVPFNPFGMNAPDVQASLEERDIGGLGIHLVRTVMDEVDYSRRGGRNVVTVTKRLKPEPDTGGAA